MVSKDEPENRLDRLDQPTTSNWFPIVGIGASAGGLESIIALLRAIPDDSGMAFVLVQHLDPHRSSALSSILAKSTSMKVQEVADGVIVCPNEVYVIAPGVEMVLNQGQLRLSPRPESRSVPLPVDTFFVSLAAERRGHATGIVLSGTGTDGTRGLTAIKAEGGMTFAQDSSALHDGMPRNAIAAGCIDFILPPEKIALELLKRQIASRKGDFNRIESGPTGVEDAAFNQILSVLKRASGIDYLHYKSPTLRRRIERRMSLNRVETWEAYLRQLNSDAAELETLQQEVLIHVTYFFRDPETFETLKATLLPMLVAQRHGGEELRIWVPGCSSGEEVYSIVICITEFLEATNSNIGIKAFATDVSGKAIDAARAGVYPDSIATDVSPDRLQRFFKKCEAGYQIDKRIRDACIFARQDVTQDPPFSQLDLISCRNVLIYLGPILQSRVFPIFHFALKPDGFLILGSAESVGTFAEFFEPVDKLRRCYRRTRTSRRPPLGLHASTTRHSGFFAPPIVADPTFQRREVRDEADRVVLNRYAPPGVVVDEDLQVIQFRGYTGRYLEPAPGFPNFDVLQMSREGLLPHLQDLIDSTKISGLVSRKQNVPFQGAHVNLEVIPIHVPPLNQSYFVVLFSEPSDIAISSTANYPPTTNDDGVRSEQDLEIAKLKQELAATKAYLQSIIEAKDVSNEELKAANEEVISSNEELQSTNEELETAKEELQATNEELETVNEELESRVDTTIHLNDELTNLIASVRIPMVIIGPDLRVRRFSPYARDVFNLISGDIGRPITDLTLGIDVPDLAALILRVLDTLEVHEQEVTDLKGHWYTLAIRPFRTSDNKIDGATVILTDINAIKVREGQVIAARDFASNIIATLHESLLVLDEGLRVRRANRSFYESFELTADRVENQLVFSLAEGQWNFPELRSLLDEVIRTDQEFRDIRIEREFGGLEKRILMLNVKRLRGEFVEGQPRLILLAIEDITRREEAFNSLKDAEQFMEVVVERAVSPIITVNEGGIVQTFNQAAETMFGYIAQDVIGNGFKMLLPQRFREHSEAVLKSYVEAGEMPAFGTAGVVIGQRRDGTTFPAELGVSETTNRNGKLFTGILVDIGERRTLEREVLSIASQEQQRIGQELHDTVGQELTGLAYLAQSLAETLKSKNLSEVIKADRVVAGLESTLLSVRSIAKGLVPVDIDSEGLMAALKSLAKRTEETTQIRCIFYCDPAVLIEDTRIATQLFLIAREAVNNCCKHARPKMICITLRLAGSDAVLEVSDDGIGITKETASKGIGLHIMAYRASVMNGKFSIENIDTGGTAVVSRIPLTNNFVV